ncbi:hypothetical protein ACVMB3_005310 [Sinorhizobium meliloti]|nr:hypothetical protein SinmeB_6099 [Sinorhizobium meliloti BL225C]SDZ55864.1 hypothetical protein SAMN04244576_06457 [Sinorhizobium meliloti]
MIPTRIIALSSAMTIMLSLHATARLGIAAVDNRCKGLEADECSLQAW